MNRVKISLFLLLALGGSISFDFFISDFHVSPVEISTDFFYSAHDTLPVPEGIRSTFSLESLEREEGSTGITMAGYINATQVDFHTITSDVQLSLQDNRLSPRTDLEIVFSKMLI